MASAEAKGEEKFDNFSLPYSIINSGQWQTTGKAIYLFLGVQLRLEGSWHAVFEGDGDMKKSPPGSVRAYAKAGAAKAEQERRERLYHKKE